VAFVAYGHPFHGDPSTSWMFFKSHENGVQGNPTRWELPGLVNIQKAIENGHL